MLCACRSKPATINVIAPGTRPALVCGSSSVCCAVNRPRLYAPAVLRGQQARTSAGPCGRSTPLAPRCSALPFRPALACSRRLRAGHAAGSPASAVPCRQCRPLIPTPYVDSVSACWPARGRLGRGASYETVAGFAARRRSSSLTEPRAARPAYHPGPCEALHFICNCRIVRARRQAARWDQR